MKNIRAQLTRNTIHPNLNGIESRFNFGLQPAMHVFVVMVTLLRFFQ